MKIGVVAGSAKDISAEGIIVGFASGSKKAAGLAAAIDRNCGGAISKVLASPEFTAKAGTGRILRPIRGRYQWIYVAGFGKGTTNEYARAAAASFGAAATSQLKTVACALPAADKLQIEQPAAVRLAAEHAVRASYSFQLGTRSGKTTLARISLAVAGKPKAAAMRAARQGAAIGEGSNLARHLAEQPPNICTPEFIARRASAELPKAGKVRVRTMKKNELVRRKMGGILAVGQGSANPPCMITATYSGGRTGSAPVVLVGKGVTFDTGGISIKPGANMDEMKFDMCGAAAVLGTIMAVARMKLALNVVAIVPAAENMPDGKSFRPGDVLRMHDGQTVEILNTDAEGRLLLADALAYAETLKPAAIVDAATLTGACVVALGNHRTGMLSRDNKLCEALRQAGDQAADPCWPLPLDDEYDHLLRSVYADVPNIGGGRAAGTITAACFLSRFVKTQHWAHLDIAGSAWNLTKRATGRPVPMLATWLAARARQLA